MPRKMPRMAKTKTFFVNMSQYFLNYSPKFSSTSTSAPTNEKTFWVTTVISLLSGVGVGYAAWKDRQLRMADLELERKNSLYEKHNRSKWFWNVRPWGQPSSVEAEKGKGEVAMLAADEGVKGEEVEAEKGKGEVAMLAADKGEKGEDPK